MEGKATRLCSLRGMDLLDVGSLSEASTFVTQKNRPMLFLLEKKD